MHTFWQTWWEIFFPPTADERRVLAATSADVLHYYQPRKQAGHLTLTSYQHPLVHSLITTNKFTANRHAAALLSILLNTYLDSCHEPVTLVPIPLSRKRYRERGHNQTTTILKQLPTHGRSQYHARRELLRRTRHTSPQTACSKAARRTNVRGAFTATYTLRPVTTTPIYIVDDVVTTGSTLQEARAALRQQYPQHPIYTVALARSS